MLLNIPFLYFVGREEIPEKLQSLSCAANNSERAPLSLSLFEMWKCRSVDVQIKKDEMGAARRSAFKIVA
jgi:hypothetical protein